MAQLTRQNDDLASVVALVRYQIGENVGDIQGQVAPHIAPRRRQMAAGSQAKVEKRRNASTAPLEGGQQLTSRYPAALDRGRDGDAVFLAEGLDPRAPGVVEMPGNHADRAARGPKRERQLDLAGREVLERDAEQPHRCLAGEARSHTSLEVGVSLLEAHWTVYLAARRSWVKRSRTAE